MIGQTLLDRYHVVSELGRGGLGIVYRAEDQLLKRPVAIKMLTQSGLDDTEGRQRLIHEARAAANLDHPNIVTVYDVVNADGATYLVMQLIDGQTLKEKRPDSLDEIISSAQQIALALDYAHTQGVVHRDIKPANVMISADNSVMLMDFGLARSVSSQLTFEGGIAGTKDYISPEQIQGEAVDGRTDIYSFGVLLYELTTGRLPFVADTPVSLLSQHLYAPVVPPIAKNASIPTSLSELIVRMMNKSAGERPETAHQVREQLDIIHDSISDPAVVSAKPQIGSLDRIVRG
jgi:serine/threonine-protein kinase